MNLLNQLSNYVFIYIKKTLVAVYISYSKLDISNKKIVEVKNKKIEVVINQYS